MSKVCYLTVQWLEEARYTADNLMIAKIMSDIGKPLDPDLNFYVKNSVNDSSLFFEAIKELFFLKSDLKKEEEITLFVVNDEIENWLQITKKISQTTMFEAFRMAEKGLESILNSSSDYFDGEMKGHFTEDGLQIQIIGTSYYMLYHEFLEEIIRFLNMLQKQCEHWEDIYNEYSSGSKRNAYHAS